MPNRFLWIAVLPAVGAAAQGTRPEAAVFHMSQQMGNIESVNSLIGSRWRAIR